VVTGEFQGNTFSAGADSVATWIFLVGGEPGIQSLIGGALTAAGYRADVVGTGTGALHQAPECRCGLIIADPAGPAARDAVARPLTTGPGQAVIVVPGRAQPAATADGVENGAEDKAVSNGGIIRAGRLSLDIGRLAANAGHGQVLLTRLEFLLLRELAEHAGQPVSKGKLLSVVWGYDSGPGSNVVDVCVRRLRSKLGFSLIKTVRGKGYQLVCQLPRPAAAWTSSAQYAPCAA
jgi:DNA-binding response OmpR family regulator